MRRHLDWVIVFVKGATNRYHAQGLAIYEKFAYVWTGDEKEEDLEIKYRYGDWTRDADNIVKEWSVGDMNLEWVDFIQPYKPTIIDRLKKFFLRKDYPSTIKVRPKDDSIVITSYRSEHYEMVEYSHHRWITDLSFPVEPQQWAYVPQECIDFAKANVIKMD